MLQDEVNKLVSSYAKKLAVYMNANLNEAINKGYNGGQEASLRLTENIIDNKNGDFTIQIIASGDYWKFIEYGVNGTKQSRGSEFSFKKGYIPSKAVGAKWQQSVGISDPRKILLAIEVKYKGITSKNKEYRQSLRAKPRDKKRLQYAEAAKRLSYIFSKSIASKGLKKRPFIDKAIQDSDIPKFQKELSEIFKKEITLTLIKP